MLWGWVAHAREQRAPQVCLMGGACLVYVHVLAVGLGRVLLAVLVAALVEGQAGRAVSTGEWLLCRVDCGKPHLAAIRQHQLLLERHYLECCRSLAGPTAAPVGKKSLGNHVHALPPPPLQVREAGASGTARADVAKR